MKSYWMAVSADNLELPIAVAESCDELARMIGRKPADIRTRAYRNEKRYGTGGHDAENRGGQEYRIYKVPKEDDD